MRRPLISRRRRHGDGRLIIGGLLVLGGVLILLRMLPPWAFWGVVAVLSIACGLSLLFDLLV
ncbi:MAG TPA: hypothetical protein DDZ53_10295 [Firmicutes bacterium]|jgi:hypothetical protein|nr:hypothetical protein [Bacillota bacterium]